MKHFGSWLLQFLGLTAGNREEDDFFGKLPDDVIIDIFGRFNNDCKFLTQCLLVNKRIASPIRLVSSLRIHIPSIKKYGIEFVMCDFNYKLISTSQDIEFQGCWKFGLDKCFFICKAREILQPFSEVKSAIVEYPSKYDLFSFLKPNTVRWLIEYSGGPVHTGIIKSCAFLGPIMTTKLDSRDRMMILTRVISDLTFASAFALYPMVAQMVQGHESLRDILITTDSRKGWIHAGEDEILKMRQAGGDASSTDKLMKTVRKKGMCITMKVKVWYDVSVLNPPWNSSSVYAFVVVSSPGNIDREVKTATSRFWGDCNYWTGHNDDERINMREFVETRPCNLEFTWSAWP